MFLKLHGIFSNEKIIINTEYIEAIQEITSDSKTYKAYFEAGAKSVIRIGGRTLPVKESVTQIENKFKAGGQEV
jgi:uncharacterized protein (DUF1330 family)